VKATRAYEAKRALFDELKTRVASGQFPSDMQIAYSYPGRDRMRVVVYGGGVSFSHTDEAEEVNLVGSEVIMVGVYIRALRPGETVEDADREVESYADAIVKVFTDQPYIAGNMTWIGVSKGNADYSETPDGPESVMSLQVSIGAILV
jgi:hypothetical protein